MTRLLVMTFFLVLVLGILGGTHYYLHLRLIRDTALPRSWHVYLTRLLIAALLSLPVAMIMSHALTGPWALFVAGPGYLWMGSFFYLLALLLCGDLIRGILLLASKALPVTLLTAPGSRLLLSRVLAVTAVGLTAVVSGVAVKTGLEAPQVRRVQVPLARLSAGLDGLRIVQLSDLHVGWLLRRSFVSEVVRRVNSLKPDIVVITGDLVDAGVPQLQGDVAPLADLRARYGVYFVTGNHEYYAGVEPWLSHLPRLGIKILGNERVTIGEGDAVLDLAGVHDYGSGHEARPAGHGADLAKALLGHDPSRELVLLAHQPKQVDQAAQHGVGLMISGHTHGGQIWPWTYLVRLNQPYVSGLHRHQGKTWVYVSPGTGHWGPPMRFGTSAEITELELHRSR